MIGVVDYGMGNLHSVEKALQRLGARALRLHTADNLNEVQALLLPGVGAFDPAMQRLEAGGWITPLRQWVESGRPLLGICLGLQLLFESSAEGNRPGLGLLAGRVEALPEAAGERVPHMGWAPLQAGSASPLLPDQATPGWMYFVHSYAAIPQHSECITATAPYGNGRVVAAVGRGQLQATQFHPEKSGRSGLQLLTNWLESLGPNGR